MTTLTSGMYVVHHKHDPSFEEDKHNFCYRIVGKVFNSDTDEEMIAYEPLYKTKRNQTQIPYQFYVKKESKFIEEMQKGETTVSRFRIFHSHEHMQSYLASLL